MREPKEGYKLVQCVFGPKDGASVCIPIKDDSFSITVDNRGYLEEVVYNVHPYVEEADAEKRRFYIATPEGNEASPLEALIRYYNTD